MLVLPLGPIVYELGNDAEDVLGVAAGCVQGTPWGIRRAVRGRQPDVVWLGTRKLAIGRTQNRPRMAPRDRSVRMA